MTTQTRKPRTPAPVALTPEQLEAQARREAARDAYQAAREALTYGHISGAPEDFTVMFGSGERFGSFRGPGLVELSVDLSCWARIGDTDDFEPPTLRFTPRSYSLSSHDGLEVCEAQGRALIEAAAFGRTLAALTSTTA